MNSALQWKLIAGFILVFVAGGMTGFFAAEHAQRAFFEWHNSALVGERMRERLRVELKLTPEQLAKISPIIDKTASQLEEIRKETGRKVHETMLEAHREMAANLTDEQRTRLQEMQARHHQWHGMHGPRMSPEQRPGP